MVPACHTAACMRGAAGQGVLVVGGARVAPADRLLRGARSGGPEEDDLHGEAGRQQRRSVQEGGQEALLVRGAALARTRWGRCHGGSGTCRDARLRLEHAQVTCPPCGLLIGFHKLVNIMDAMYHKHTYAFRRWY